MVTVYTKNNCMQCKLTKRNLQENGIEYQEVNTDDDEKALETVLGSDIPMPEIKISVYKNRRGRWKNVLLWCRADRGTCRIEPIFMTDFQYKLIEIEDLKINVNPKIQASAF